MYCIHTYIYIYTRICCQHPFLTRALGFGSCPGEDGAPCFADAAHVVRVSHRHQCGAPNLPAAERSEGSREGNSEVEPHEALEVSDALSSKVSRRSLQNSISRICDFCMSTCDLCDQSTVYHDCLGIATVTLEAHKSIQKYP